jgi:hypothetical protein
MNRHSQFVFTNKQRQRLHFHFQQSTRENRYHVFAGKKDKSENGRMPTVGYAWAAHRKEKDEEKECCRRKREGLKYLGDEEANNRVEIFGAPVATSFAEEERGDAEAGRPFYSF